MLDPRWVEIGDDLIWGPDVSVIAIERAYGARETTHKRVCVYVDRHNFAWNVFNEEALAFRDKIAAAKVANRPNSIPSRSI